MPKLILILLAVSAAAMASEDQAMKLAQSVAERPANEGRVGTMHFRLTNASGATRTRRALMIHAQDAATTRIAIFFEAPAMIAETAFLSFDHIVEEDQNWLFLPATQRVRRLPVSDRGDYFLGTDLTYGDIKDNFKFALEDWHFDSGGMADHNEQSYPALLGTAKSEAISSELGYSSFRALIDTRTRFPVQIEYSDEQGTPLKRVEVLELEQVGGAWTAMRFVVTHLQSGHTTEVHFSNMRHVPELEDSILEPSAMAYGIPDVG